MKKFMAKQYYLCFYLIDKINTYILYDEKLDLLHNYNNKSHYTIFYKPIKISCKNIKKNPYNKIHEKIIKNKNICHGFPETQPIKIVKLDKIPLNDYNLLEPAGYLYIVKEREFINSKKCIYKIGCTNNIKRRYSQYPKGSILIYSIISKNFREIEKLWINKLKNNNELIKRNDIGMEYFEGNYITIINELTNLIVYSEII